MGRTNQILIFSVFLFSLTVARPDAANGAQQQLPLGRNFDSTLLDQALQLPAEKLIEFIESQGVKVYLYPSTKPRNPEFASGEMIPAKFGSERYLKGLFEDKGSGSTVYDAGVFSQPKDPEVGKYGNTIVITECSSAHTLLHEFTHYLFYTTEKNPNAGQKWDLEERAVRTLNEFGRQYTYSFIDLGMSDKYKRDVLIERLIASIQIERDRVYWFASEEIMIEKVLAEKIHSDSPYFETERFERGKRYAAANVRNSRLELAKHASAYADIAHGFMRVAGAYPATSVAESEEIITSLPKYRDAVFNEIEGVAITLKVLEEFNAQPTFAATSVPPTIQKTALRSN